MLQNFYSINKTVFPMFLSLHMLEVFCVSGSKELDVVASFSLVSYGSWKTWNLNYVNF